MIRLNIIARQKSPDRPPIRIPGYDYLQPGWYFVIICTNDNELLFGNVFNGKMVLNDIGQIIAET